MTLIFVLSLISSFVFLYPLLMSIVWTIGGLVFYLRWEKRPLPRLPAHPLVSIIVPAHNEEKVIEDALQNLSDLNYPEYEVLVVDDGSTDRTAEILDHLAGRHAAWLRVIHLKPNSGKSKALNVGVLLCRGQFVVTMDADSYLDPDALLWMMDHLLTYPRVGAVTGNPRVLNRTTLLSKIQIGEYSSIIGLIKRTQRLLGKVLTVSGVIAAFRKSALLECGLFDSDTVTEDIDITWKMQRRFWDVRYEPKALCWVLVPETLEGLWRQRIRWAQGGLEVMKKHLSIWKDTRQRRLWPVYIEYLLGVVWAHLFLLISVLWLLSLFLSLFFSFIPVFPYAPFIPKWEGSILAVTCLLQFIVSLLLDRQYEKKSLLKYYFWVVWYALFYWVLCSLAVIVSLYKMIFLMKETVTWKSPDRGLHTLKSSTSRP
jgi:biofilm PGA synthesis N-glycosyltransferase PgaC